MSPEISPLRPNANKRILIILSVLFSGIFWYLSDGLTGDYWYLLWIAPIPILFVSFKASSWQSFLIAFIAYALGRLSWLEYALSLVPLMGVIIFTLFFPLFFALVVILTRKIVLALPHWISVFAFPALWTTFEFIFFKLSPDGTAGSIAYSQSDFLPIAQMASVTGILGITFLVCLFPSAIAVLWHYRKNKQVIVTGSVISVLVLSAALIFGEIRLNSSYSGKNAMTVGIASIDEKYYDSAYYTNNKGSDTTKEMQIVKLYLQQIDTLARQGAKVILLPEKIITTDNSLYGSISTTFRESAIQNKTAIINSYTRVIDNKLENAGFAITSEGKMLTGYTKVKLFEWEAARGYVAGQAPGLFQLNQVPSGIAICKDMDFQDYIRTYDLGHPEILFVPAWDFVADGWLHSRMANMRGVENGYAVVRDARSGRLTISDYRGKVNYEANSESGEAVALLGNISFQNTSTLYSRFGNWFGIINLIFAGGLLILGFVKSGRITNTEASQKVIIGRD